MTKFFHGTLKCFEKFHEGIFNASAQKEKRI